MKIALIGPGGMPIPPTGWGAVEIVMWNYKRYLERNGHVVTIYNTPDLQSVAESVNSYDYDFIHLHYDEHVPFFNGALKKPYCATTHYGWLLQREKWEHHYYDRIFDACLQLPGLIALSPNIANIYSSNGFSGFLKYLRNGVECSDFRIANSPSKDVVCIGKIEPRKRQAKLAILLNNKINIDFVGPRIDPNFVESTTNKYIGTWDKPALYNNLTDYSALILASDGEAAPLVVLEALAAGVSVIVSEAASENLVTSSYVKVIPESILNDSEKLADIVKETCDNNCKYRQDILNYARSNFDFSVIISEYEKIVEDFRSI